MPYTNIHRGARISPLKVRSLMDLIRGKRIDEADQILAFSKRRGAVMVRTALAAARENADNVGELSASQMRRLYVSDARVDSGPTIKRFRPKDRGRAHPIKKRTSHITVSVDVLPEA